jgi:hypothetical protein
MRLLWDKDRSGKHKARAKVQPGILLSWEAFNDEAMREWLQELVAEVEDELDELEEALRNPN